jgi:hypothetical protein
MFLGSSAGVIEEFFITGPTVLDSSIPATPVLGYQIVPRIYRFDQLTIK